MLSTDVLTKKHRSERNEHEIGSVNPYYVFLSSSEPLSVITFEASIKHFITFRMIIKIIYLTE